MTNWDPRAHRLGRPHLSCRYVPMSWCVVLTGAATLPSLRFLALAGPAASGRNTPGPETPPKSQVCFRRLTLGAPCCCTRRTDSWDLGQVAGDGAPQPVHHLLTSIHRPPQQKGRESQLSTNRCWSFVENAKIHTSGPKASLSVTHLILADLRASGVESLRAGVLQSMTTGIEADSDRGPHACSTEDLDRLSPS